MKHHTVIIAALVGILMQSPAVFANPDSHGGSDNRSEHFSPEQRKKMALKMFEKLDLDATQEKQMKEFLEDHLESGGGMKAAFEEKEKLDSLLRSSVATDEEIRAQADITGQQFMDSHRKRLERLLQIKKILRPEQFERLLTKMHSWREKGRHGGKERRDKHHGR